MNKPDKTRTVCATPCGERFCKCYPDTRHLDTAIGILKGGTAKRAKATTFTLTRTGYTVGKDCYDAILQGARGKTVATYANQTWDAIVADAQARAAKIPGATLTIYQ